MSAWSCLHPARQTSALPRGQPAPLSLFTGPGRGRGRGAVHGRAPGGGCFPPGACGRRAQWRQGRRGSGGESAPRPTSCRLRWRGISALGSPHSARDTPPSSTRRPPSTPPRRRYPRPHPHRGPTPTATVPNTPTARHHSAPGNAGGKNENSLEK